MTTLGFSGTRQFSTVAQMTSVLRLREQFNSYDKFVTGACTGFDAVMGFWLAQHYPKAEHLVIVPANKTQIYAWWNFRYTAREREAVTINVRHMPPVSSYKSRNQAIVDNSDALFFCAEFAEDDERSLRSGTWQTVRMAMEAELPIFGVVLDSGDVFV